MTKIHRPFDSHLKSTQNKLENAAIDLQIQRIEKALEMESEQSHYKYQVSDFNFS